MSGAGLSIAVQATLGAFRLDATFDTPPQGMSILFGPSGAGKSTLLRMIAGVQRPDAGHIRFGDVCWHDSATRQHTPPHQRGIGYVFQDGALFPHLDVQRNLDYGHVRTPRTARTLSRDFVIDFLGLAPLLSRMPEKLSGGESQRVAIGRAILAGPQLLLLDEPMSALDDARRREIVPMLARLHRELKIPMLLVTHSLADVARLGDFVVQIAEGRVERTGPMAAMLPHLAARAERLAILEGAVVACDTAHHLVAVETPFGPLWAAHDAPLGARLRLVISAREVSLARHMDAASSILNQPQACIVSAESAGPGQLLVTLAPISDESSSAHAHLGALLTTRSWELLGLACGDVVVARVKGVAVAAG